MSLKQHELVTKLPFISRSHFKATVFKAPAPSLDMIIFLANLRSSVCVCVSHPVSKGFSPSPFVSPNLQAGGRVTVDTARPTKGVSVCADAVGDAPLCTCTYPNLMDNRRKWFSADCVRRFLSFCCPSLSGAIRQSRPLAINTRFLFSSYTTGGFTSFSTYLKRFIRLASHGTYSPMHGFNSRLLSTQ